MRASVHLVGCGTVANMAHTVPASIAAAVLLLQALHVHVRLAAGATCSTNQCGNQCSSCASSSDSLTTSSGSSEQCCVPIDTGRCSGSTEVRFSMTSMLCLVQTS